MPQVYTRTGHNHGGESDGSAELIIVCVVCFVEAESHALDQAGLVWL